MAHTADIYAVSGKSFLFENSFVQQYMYIKESGTKILRYISMTAIRADYEQPSRI
jgi:hypothetical protein